VSAKEVVLAIHKKARAHLKAREPTELEVVDLLAIQQRVIQKKSVKLQMAQNNPV
jgi:hypothetical protein